MFDLKTYFGITPLSYRLNYFFVLLHEKSVPCSMNNKLYLIKMTSIGRILKNIVLGLFLIQFDECNAENDLFTSTADMKALHDVQGVRIANIKKYIEEQEHKLVQLQKKIEFYDFHHNEASINLTDYLSNPINVYLMTKRVTADWEYVEKTISHDLGTGIIKNITDHTDTMKFPTVDDLHGASLGLARLQRAYNLETKDIANGILNGIKYGIKLSAEDCYEIGLQLYYAKEYRYAIKWFLEAESRLADFDTKHDEELIINLKAQIALTHSRLGNSVESFKISHQLLSQFEQEGQEALERINEVNTPPNLAKDHENMLEHLKSTDIGQAIPIIPEIYDIHQRVRYEKLCSKNIIRSAKELTSLRCRYVTNKSHFLRIAPLKLEEVSHDPYIVIYVDVLYDSEIQKIQELAQPKFQRATIIHYGGKEPVQATTERTSKSAWLNGTDHKLIQNVELRSEDMMGLTESTAEALQVVNYGIGGHYDPHYDFSLRDNKTFSAFGTGNRISTVLFYMSDVEQGGATVFPYLNVALWPQKGSAVVWYNLYKSGKGDNRTKHAACPVLVGNKWVCNKWFHEKGQDQLRPCSLQPDH